MKEQTFSREEIYELIWSSPLTSIAKKYCISDVGLRKICIKMGIPLPKSGYWIKLKYNKPIKKVMLPQNFTGEKEVTLYMIEEGDPVKTIQHSPTSLMVNQIIASEGNRLKVPTKLTNPCNQIIPLIKALKAKKHYYTNGGLLRLSYFDLNINVTPKLTDRALRFMDTFLKIIEHRGHKIYNDNRLTFLLIRNEKIQIRLTEKLNRVLKPSTPGWPEYDYSPTGILLFSCVADYNNTTWKDGKLPLENQLANIVAGLEIKGAHLVQKRIEREARWAEQREINHILEEKQKRKEKELNDFKNLLKSCQRWHVSQILRNFINVVEANLLKNNESKDETPNWHSWARAKANWLDPLIASEDEYLSEKDKDIIAGFGIF